MSLTHADVVVMARPDVAIGADSLRTLAAVAATEGVAIASPQLASRVGAVLGRQERGLLELAPQPTAGSSGIVAVPFASPELFAISRRAFEQLGPFDQDITGDLALAEWVLRATGRQLRCVGVAEATASAVELRDSGSASETGEADRLVILARHRPQQLAAAALASTSLWQQEPMALAGALRAIFRRLPHAGELAAAVDLLVVQAQTVAGWKRLAPTLRDRLIALAAELNMAPAPNISDPALVSLVENMLAAVARLRGRGADVEGLHREVDELRQAVVQRDQLEQALRQDIIARSNTIDALRQELIEREHAIASLREELGHRQGERDRLIDHLGAVQQETDRLQDSVDAQLAESAQVRADFERDQERLRAEVGAARDDAARLREDLAAARAHVARVEAELQTERARGAAAGQASTAARAAAEERTGAVAAEAIRRAGDLEQRLAVEVQRSRDLEHRLAQAIAGAREVEVQLGKTRDELHRLQQVHGAELQRLQQAHGEESARLQSVLREIDQLRGGHELLRREHGSLQEQRVELEARAHELIVALRDRERWIAELLLEVQERRLRRRDLSPLEAEFLARQRGERRS